MASILKVRPRDTPLLIYDGDCSFCKFWVEYWKSLTGEKISYAAYQNVFAEFPEISLAEFRAAVKFIDRDGSSWSGAEAVFRALACIPGKQWPLWLYNHIPGFAPVSEFAYAFVARRRGAFYSVTRLLWGRRLEPARYAFTRALTMRLMGVIYLIAFASWLAQARGLIGSNGLLPAQDFLAGVRDQLGFRAYFRVPTLVWLHPTDGAIEILAGAGVALAVPVIAGIAMGPCLLGLWVLYLSQVSIGQDFMSFQWDILLLEAGFLSVFFASWKLRDGSDGSQPSTALVWLFRWLVFRLFFLSGVVKLASGDPAWRNFTALSFHYETQPLPTIFAWYLFQLPLWFQKLSTAFVFFTELAVPVLIFAPRRIRHGAARLLILLQVLIFVTGNYCFFNLLAIVLCLFLFDDAFFLRRFPWAAGARESSQRKPRSRRMRALTGCVAAALLALSLAQLKLQYGSGLPRAAADILAVVEPFYFTSTYGLFAVMTTTRPEIVVEGSDDGERWLPYGFKYKPGALDKPPSWVQPHQPRLDWQMWFAALGTYRSNPWIQNLAVRLLQGSPSVLRLLRENPFPDHPPRYIRAVAYDYRFTSFQEKRASGNWWAREPLGAYLPPVSLQSF